MACEKIKVCHNTRCKNQGSQLVIQDIEELVQGACPVVTCGCLGKCGEGPNVEIDIDGVPTIYSNISTFKNAMRFVQETADLEVPADVAKVGLAKYDARRMTDPTQRLEMMDKCISMAEKDVKSTCQPKLLADSLVMRSKELLGTEPRQALEDAEKAAKLAPAWAQALIALAAACESTSWPSRGLKAAREALKTGMCFEKLEVRKLINRLTPLAKDEQDAPDKYEKMRSAGPKPRKSTGADVVAVVKKKEYPSNIYAKFGGRPKFTELAYAVHEAMFQHALTKDFFPPTMDNTRITERNVDFLSGAFGGPKYKGPDMVITHEFLRITNAQYDVMMDAYKVAIDKMKIHEMFSEPIFRQLEGMRSSIVYRKDRPGPLARKYENHLGLHKEVVQKRKDKKDKKEKKEKRQDKTEDMADLEADSPSRIKRTDSGRGSVLSRDKADFPSTPSPKSKPTAKAKTKAKAKKNLLMEAPSPISTEPLKARAILQSFDGGISDAVTAYTSSDKECVTAAAEDSFEKGQSDTIDKCPVSGRSVQEALAKGAGTCPFYALLAIPDARPARASLLQSLQAGRVALADFEAEPTSPTFGVVSM